MSFSFKACGLSDVGLARNHNEDCFGIDAKNRLVVVADGMGGHSHGEVAARIAVQSIREYVDVHAASLSGAPTNGSGPTKKAQKNEVCSKADTDETGIYDSSDSPTKPGVETLPEPPEDLADHCRLLETALQRAHDQVLGAIREDGTLYGMGTTVVGMLLQGNTAAVAHVGDSRAYRLRDGRMELLTQDHTWVHEQVMAGFLSAEQARVHPLKNVITRALGGENDIVVDIKELEVAEGDLFLLCSDGLTTMLTDPDIFEAVNLENGLEEACRSLVDAANNRGGLDNVTVVLVAVEGTPS